MQSRIPMLKTRGTCSAMLWSDPSKLLASLCFVLPAIDQPGIGQQGYKRIFQDLV